MLDGGFSEKPLQIMLFVVLRPKTRSSSQQKRTAPASSHPSLRVEGSKYQKFFISFDDLRHLHRM